MEKTRALARMTEAEQAQSHSREIAEKALTQEAEARRRVDELLEREKTLRQAGEARVYATDIHLAQRAIDQDNFDRARDLLARHYPRSGQTNRPGWEWRHLWQQVRSDAAFEVCRFPGFVRLALGASASPGTRWLASEHRDDHRAWIELLDVTHLQAPRKAGEIVLPSSNVISALALGARNGLIAHAQAPGTFLLMSPEPLATIGIHDAATRRTLATITNLAGLCLELQWSGDGRHLLSSRVGVDREGSGRRIDVWRAPDLTHVATLKDFPKLERGLTGFSVAVTTDASAVALTGPNYPLSVLDVATGAIRWRLPSQARGFRELAYDGRTLFAAEDADPWVLRVFDFLTGKELSPPLVHEDGGLPTQRRQPHARRRRTERGRHPATRARVAVGDTPVPPRAEPGHARLLRGRPLVCRRLRRRIRRGLGRPRTPPGPEDRQLSRLRQGRSVFAGRHSARRPGFDERALCGVGSGRIAGTSCVPHLSPQGRSRTGGRPGARRATDAEAR